MKVAMTGKALEWLRMMLVQPAWKQDEKVETAMKRQYVSCVLLFDKLPEAGSADAEFTQTEVDVITSCIRYHVKLGAVPSTRETYELLQIFKLVE